VSGAKLWDKYLVLRRDGTVPHWPYFVIAAADPAAPAALLAYAARAEELGMDAGYVADIRGQAGDFDRWRTEHGAGDPDAPRHRTDDPAVVTRIRGGSRRVYPPGSHGERPGGGHG
jgi:hypothetical protein